MRDKLNKFMQGRYGVDQLSRFTLGVALFIVVIGSFCRRNMAGGVLDLLGFVLIIYTYVRILSRNIQKRYAENQKYLAMTQNIRGRFMKEKRMMEQRKTHHIYTCPGCGPKDPHSQRKWSEDRNRMSEVSQEVYQEEIKCLAMW